LLIIDYYCSLPPQDNKLFHSHKGRKSVVKNLATVLTFCRFVLLGALLPFSGCGLQDKQFADLRLVASPQALQRMDMSPIFKQPASMSWSRMRNPTVAMDGGQVIHIDELTEELGWFRLAVVSSGEI